MTEGFEFGPLTESELPEAIVFLRNAFGTLPDEPVRAFRSDVMRWKCFGPHPYWQGSRAFAVRHRGGIVAYGAVAPAEILSGGAALRAFCLMDWAAHKDFPGTGVLIYTQLQRRVDVPFAVGGSDAAQAIIPKLGYRFRQELPVFGRVIRPWRQFRGSGDTSWRAPLRLLRDVVHASGRASDSRFSAHRTDCFDDRLTPVLPKDGDVLVLRRTVESLNYALLCPAAEMSGYYVFRGGTLTGYCMLSRVGSECRIADLWIRASGPADWRAAYTLAARLASRYPEVTQVAAAPALPDAQAGIVQAGFRRTRTRAVRVRDPRGLLPANKPLAIGLIENDHFYL